MNDAELQAVLTAEMRKGAAVIEAPVSELPPFAPQDAAVPFVKVSDGVLHWIVVERGEELDHRETRDVREWLSWVFRAVTRRLAARWELAHRIAYVESRLPIFCKHLELMARLDEGWAADALAAYRRTLTRSPYEAEGYPRDDEATRSLRFLAAQVRGGEADEVAAAEAIIYVYALGQPLTRSQEAFATCALIAYEQYVRKDVPIEALRAQDPWARRLLEP
jgi:Immunity protein 63